MKSDGHNILDKYRSSNLPNWKCLNRHQILILGRCEVEDDLIYCSLLVYELLRTARNAVSDEQAGIFVPENLQPLASKTSE